jgi:crotonobetainyl-CoA:carnitine CoA-transferase CaiB-like acyl-CoA transferase
VTAPPLAGSVVLSLGHTLPGLYCLAALRDLGAEVVRVERPARAGAGAYAGLARQFPVRSLVAGTSQLALDLAQEAGRDAFRRLAARADAVLEGFRPGVARRLGIDHETLRAEHPELVYVAISGYGQDSPWRDRAGHDVNYLAETGVLALSNPRGLPGATFADGLAGLAAALNLVAARLAARATGRGAFVDLAIVDAPLFLMASELEHFWLTGDSRGAGDTHLTGRYPWYGVHATRDGGAVAVGAVEPAFHAALCRGIGHPELAERQHAEGEDLEAARAAFAAAFAARGRDEALARLEAEDACASALRSTAEVARSPLMQRALRTGAEEPLVRPPVRLEPAPLAPEIAGARVLERFGFSRDEVEALVRAEALA